MNNDTGVYAITSPSGRKYIGSTISFERRWKEHRQYLRQGRHHSSALQRAWDKYGEEAMVFEKIALCSITDLLAVEQARIDSLEPEYNICRVAGNSTGVRRTEETRKLQSSLKKGRPPPNKGKPSPMRGVKTKPQSAETKRKISLAKMGCASPRKGVQFTDEHLIKITGANSANAKPVICIETGRQFWGAREAQQWLRENGWPRAANQNISLCCNGKARYAYGFTWRFADPA
jgi:group I intron endonuclease